MLWEHGFFLATKKTPQEIISIGEKLFLHCLQEIISFSNSGNMSGFREHVIWL